MTTELLSPSPKQHFIDSNGNALSGGKLFTYQAGTTTKLATYTDSTGNTPNTNPIILDSRGECNCWIPPNTAYKFVLSPSTDSDPPTNPIWTVDNITATSVTTPVAISQGGTGQTTALAALQALGSVFNKYVTLGTSTLAASNAGQVIAPSTTGVTLTMPPTAGLSNGDTFAFLQPNASDTLTITQNSSEKFYGPGFAGVNSVTLTVQYDFIAFLWDGTQYRVISMGSFPRSIAASGYMTLPGGLILQWGSVTFSGASTASVTFPIQFPTAALAAVTSFGIAAGTNVASGPATLTATGFTFNLGSSSTGTGYWFAVGH